MYLNDNGSPSDWDGYGDMEPPEEFDYPEDEGFSQTLSGTPPQELSQELQERDHAEPQVSGQELPSEQAGTPSRNSAHPFKGAREFPGPQHGYRFMEADDFLFSVDEGVPVWGYADTPLWQSGESLMLVGPPGVGKSTLAHNLIIALLTGGEVLGHPVARIEGDVLYLAMDRPKQIARAFRRLVDDPDTRKLVNERVIFHAGPLPINLVKDPTIIARMCQKYGVSVVVIDSIKDIVSSPSDETMANSYNSARQKCLAEGIEWVELHHNRKANGDNKEPKGLDDVYGNRFITAGAGSIFSLWAVSGEVIISLTHIRMPGNGLNQMKMELDKDRGTLTPMDVVTMDSLIRRSIGVTVKEAAFALYGEKYSDSDSSNVRNKLKRMVANKQAYEDRTTGEIRYRHTSQAGE